MTIRTRRRRNTLTALVLGAVLVGIHYAYDAALYDSAFLSGWSLFAMILFLSMLNLRKKITMLPMGSSAKWLQLHIYAGGLAILLFAIHIGWQVPTGIFEISLAIIFSLVAGTGLVGIFLSRILPKRLTRRGEEVILERIPSFISEVREQAEQVIIRSATETSSNTIREFYSEHLHFFFVKPRNFFQHLFSSNRGLFTLLTEIDNADRYLNSRESELLSELRSLVMKKDELDFHFSLQTTLKAWLLIHIPATFGLIILAVLHLIIVYAFGGGIG